MNLKVMLFGNRPTEAEKRKAAMALNLCATSISRIIASNDMEVLDVEYNAILNWDERFDLSSHLLSLHFTETSLRQWTTLKSVPRPQRV